MNSDRLKQLRQMRRDRFKAQCDAHPMQEKTCAGCNTTFTTRFDYEIHLQWLPGSYTPGGYIEGEYVCPGDVQEIEF